MARKDRKSKEHEMSLIGLLSDLTQRTDLSELSMCKGRLDRCEYPPGYHDEQRRADEEWRATNGQ